MKQSDYGWKVGGGKRFCVTPQPTTAWVVHGADGMHVCSCKSKAMADMIVMALDFDADVDDGSCKDTP